MTERQLKYQWRRTWPDRSHDFVCEVDGEIVGRVQLHTSGPLRAWTWSMSIDRVGFIATENGSEDDKMEACRRLEKAFDAAIAERTKEPGDQ